MDSPTEGLDLVEGYESPQAKIARMLADIDNASTPSTAGPDERLKATRRFPVQHNGTSSAVPNVTQDPYSDEEDTSPTRPVGRVAKRMLLDQHNGDTDNDDRYSVTPIKTNRQLKLLSHSALDSPTPSERSPGLFVSPAKTSSNQSDSDDDLPTNPLSGPSRLAELVAAKRTERLAREAANKRPSSPTTESIDDNDRRARSSQLPDSITEDTMQVPAEPELERILSDAARPTRKASKKAMLEMERETQRLAREQALAHQMKTKKRFTTTDLFARMGFRQAQLPPTESSSSSAPNSDAADDAVASTAFREPLSTPPSSPPTPWDAQKALVERGALTRMVPVREDSITSLAGMQVEDDNEEMPDVADIIRQARTTKATRIQQAPESPSRFAAAAAAARIRLKFSQLPPLEDASDEELDIVQPMPTHLQAFDRVKTVGKHSEVQSKAFHALKHLAQLSHDPSASTNRRKMCKPVIPPNAVNAQLIATAKAHARQAQQQRLQELQAKGIVIMSAEEQEREADQIDNLLEKARQEAEEIRKKEKAASRKANEAELAASEDEDEDWVASGEEDEFDEEEQEEEEEEEEENALIHQDAAEASSEDEDEAAMTLDEPAEDKSKAVAKDNSEHSEIPITNNLGQRKVRVVIDDDDDDDNDEDEYAPIDHHEQPVANDGPLRETNPFAAFGCGLDTDGPELMSPTAAFAATMETPTQHSQATYRDSIFRNRPTPSAFHIPPAEPLYTTGQAANDESRSQFVPASQLNAETQEVNLNWETQMPETPIPAIKGNNTRTIDTPGWEPSQDAGLPSPWIAPPQATPVASSIDQHETQSTVRVRISESPQIEPIRNKGRLIRGMRQVDSDSEDEPAVPAQKSKDAFKEMQRLCLQSMNAAERAAAEKEMKDMMDDLAEESEDEYAGLGGDDSNMIAPETEEDRAMIDESNIEIDEAEARDMQKFYAERQRAAEEEATSKLYKDLTTGALRRRQGVGWELDEDEDELAARRRQIRQREEARKRRLLLQDDNVKGLLESKGDSKGKEAFLRTIGDEDDLIENLELDEPANDESASSQDHTKTQDGPLNEISSNKRKLEDIQDSEPRAKVRRTRENEAAFTRPTSMLQIQESLSFLLEEPAHALSTSSTSESDNEDDTELDEDNNGVEQEFSRDNDGGYAPDLVRVSSLEMPPPPLPSDRLPASQRRTAAKPAVIDRLSLRRGSSSNSSSGSMGWSAWSTNTGAASKVPSLLRRATSNLSAASDANERGVSHGSVVSNAMPRGGSISGGTRIGGSKKSSLAYQSRAEERKAIGERAERKREENRRKIAEIRRQQGGALVGKGLDSGQWE